MSNALMAVMGHLELLRQRTDLPDEARRRLREISAGADRIREQLERLAEATRNRPR